MAVFGKFDSILIALVSIGAIIRVSVFSGLIVSVKGHEATLDWNIGYETYEFNFLTDIEPRKTDDGNRFILRPITILQLIISPLTFLFHIVSVIFAIIAMFSNHVWSWCGAIDYTGVPVKLLQKPLHFFFNFVFV